MTRLHARELTPAPEDPGARVFALGMRGGLGDCSPSGRVRLDAIARWLQDVAFGDVEEAGVAEAAVWVVRSTRIVVERFPRFAEPVEVATWCSGLGRMWAERRTAVRGEAGGAVEAVSVWVHLDPVRRRPTELTPAELAVYGPAVAARRITARLRHPAPGEGALERADGGGRWTFRAGECDLADHVNNAAYWAVLEEELLGAPEPSSIDAEVEFRTPSQPGEQRVLADGPLRWLLDGSGAVSASVLLRAAP